MGFGTPPTVLEGDYSDWTIYDTFEDADASGGGLYEYPVLNKAETKIILVDAVGDKIKVYDIASKSLTTLTFTDPITERGYEYTPRQVGSIQGTYLCFVDDEDYVKIVKDGVIVKTLSYTDLGLSSGWVNYATISHTGKYVVVVGKFSATGNIGWVVLMA